MPAIESAFNSLESRLQSLVEGNLARLFPNSTWQTELARRLSEALRDGAQSVKGTLLAPDQYTIFMPSDKVIQFLESPALLSLLAEQLDKAGVEAGYRFQTRPTLRALPSPEKDSTIQVVAQFTVEQSGQTDYFIVEPEQRGSAHRSIGAFLIVDGTRLFSLAGSVVNIGRLSENHLAINDGRVSRRHAQIRTVRSRYMIVDLGSSGGTFVNDQRVTQAKLNPGDVISLAGVPLVFGIETGDQGTATQELRLDRG